MNRQGVHMRGGSRRARLLLLAFLLPHASLATAQEAAGEGPAIVEFHAVALDVHEAIGQLRQIAQRNVVVAPGVQATFTGDLYNLDFAQAVDLICASTGLTARDDGAFLFLEPVEPQVRVWRLDYARAFDVLNLVTPLLSPQGQATATTAPRQGIASDQEAAGGDDFADADALIVRDLPTRLAQIANVVAAVDRAPRQVIVDATILTAEITDEMQFGVDFTSLVGQSFGGTGATSTDGLSLIPGGLDETQLDGTGAASTALLDGFSSGGLQFGVIKNHVAGFVRALDDKTNVTILASPRILTLNKQRGEVLLGRRDGYLTTTVTQTASIQSVEFLETGTRLIFRPFISSDGHVRLEIHPEDSDGGLNDQGLPFKETTEVTTNILLMSGETVVIGGLFREKADLRRQKVPRLGDLPGLGLLFGSSRRKVVREEIIILLTPHVLGNKGSKGLRIPVGDGGRTPTAVDWLRSRNRSDLETRMTGEEGP